MLLHTDAGVDRALYGNTVPQDREDEVLPVPWDYHSSRPV